MGNAQKEINLEKGTKYPSKPVTTVKNNKLPGAEHERLRRRIGSQIEALERVVYLH